jgi:hypothetical protein
LPSANDVGVANDVGFRLMMCGFATFLANIASLRNAVEQHHFERSEKHHIAAGDASLRYTRLRLDLLSKVWYNKLKKGGKS